MLVVGSVCVAVAALLERRGLGGWDLGSDLDRLTAGSVAVIVAAAWLSTAGARSARIVAAMLASAAVVPHGIAVADAIGTGLPGPSTGVLAVGCAVLVAGTAARALHPDAAPRGGPRQVALVGAGVAAATVLAAWGAAVVVVDAPLVTRTAAASTAVEPDPDRVQGIAWRWEPAESVADVRAAGVGVVVALDDGVVALDGGTGAERWEFRRDGAALTGLQVSPDRRTVVLTHGTTAADSSVLTVLDADTGSRRWEAVVVGAPALLVTDGVVAVDRRIGEEDDDGERIRLDAFDLATGRSAWSWESPGGCDTSVLYPVSVTTVVPVQTVCPAGTTLLGLDEQSGRLRWSLATDGPESESSDHVVRGLAHGTRLVTDGGDDTTLLIDPERGEVLARLDPSAGYPIPVPEGRIVLEDPDSGLVDAAVDPATDRPAPVVAGCADERNAVVLAQTVVRLCDTGGTLDAEVDGTTEIALGLIGSSRARPLDPFRYSFVVPAPGAVVVGSTAGSLVGLS